MTAKRTKSDTPRMPDVSDEPDRCIAHGCPLRATIFDTVSGPRHAGRCRYHDAIPPKHWPQLTEALNRGDVEAFRAMGLHWKEPSFPFKREHRTKSGHVVTGPVTFREWFEHFKANTAELRPPQVGSFIHVGAMLSDVPIDFEAAEERRAIQSEGELL